MEGARGQRVVAQKKSWRALALSKGVVAQKETCRALAVSLMVVVLRERVSLRHLTLLR